VTAATLSPNLPIPQSSSSLSTISTSSSITNANATASSLSVSAPTAADSKPKTRPRSASQRDASYDPYVERKKAHLEKMKQREKMLYNDAVECPICFLVSDCWLLTMRMVISYGLFVTSITLPTSTTLVVVISPSAPNALFRFIAPSRHPQCLLHVPFVWRRIMAFCTSRLRGARNSRLVLEAVRTAQ